MSQPAPNPPQLAKFPPAAQEAFARYQATGDQSAVHTVVLAILQDFAPRRMTSAEPLADSLRLVQDLGFDSLAVAETVFFIEDLFEVRITNQDLAGLGTVGELRAFVVSKLSARAGSA